MDTEAHNDDRVLSQLRADFTGHRIWRSVRWDGSLGAWVATLHDPAAGVDATILKDTAAELREALLQERARAVAKRLSRS
ncbi:hypothetical protein [Spirillospora albida]|uniref:hypothetical protein n=1 Tax=Spirillospora albida TaxID=58123 RepID=UPI0004BE77EF|nr:hypothetical protein [Spirillospora albida]